MFAILLGTPSEAGLFASLPLQTLMLEGKMAVSDQDRYELHGRLEEVLGQDPAATLMAHLPPVGWADLATKQDVVALGERLDARIDRLDAKIDHDVGLLGAKVDHVEAMLGAKIEVVRLGLEGTLHRQLNIQMRVMVAALAATASVIIAAVRF